MSTKFLVFDASLVLEIFAEMLEPKLANINILPYQAIPVTCISHGTPRSF